MKHWQGCRLMHLKKKSSAAALIMGGSWGLTDCFATIYKPSDA
jgi:hypothetical protein